MRTQKLLQKSFHQHFPLVCTSGMINTELSLAAASGLPSPKTLSKNPLTMNDGLYAECSNWLIRQLKSLKGT